MVIGIQDENVSNFQANKSIYIFLNITIIFLRQRMKFCKMLTKYQPNL